MATIVPRAALAADDEPASAAARTPTRADFAEDLLRERDYARAAGVYKELAFFASEPAQRAAYLYEVAQAERLGRKYELAIASFSAVLEAPGVTPSLAQRAYLQLATTALAMRVPAQVPLYLERATGPEFAPIARVLRGSAAAQEGRWDDARALYAHAAEGAPGTRIGALAREFEGEVAHASELPSRSPWLAAGLSALVPGAGQVYTGHYVDALQAFAFIGAFAVSSYAAYRFDASEGHGYALTGAMLSITAIFHATNVVGAERTARYFNERARDGVLGPIDARLGALRF